MSSAHLAPVSPITGGNSPFELLDGTFEDPVFDAETVDRGRSFETLEKLRDFQLGGRSLCCDLAAKAVRQPSVLTLFS